MADLLTNPWAVVPVGFYLFFLVRSLARLTLGDWKTMRWDTVLLVFTIMPLGMVVTDILEATDRLFWRNRKN
jgi:hypothetical protein